MRVAPFVIENRIIDLGRASVAFTHFGIGIVGSRAGARREVNDLQAEIFSPADDLLIVPLVRWYKIGRIFASNTKRQHLAIVFEQILFEFIFCDQQAIALYPVRIQQMLIGMSSQVVAGLPDIPDQGLKCRLRIEVSR